MRKATLSYWYAASAVLLWSTVSTAFKIGLRQLDVFQFIFIASGVSLIIFFLILLFQKKVKLLFLQSKKQLLTSILFGLINPLLYYIILFKAYSLLPGQLAQPINMIWPIALALLSVPMLKQEIGWRNFLSMAVSFIGVVFISSQGSVSGFENTNFSGVLLALASSFIWAFYWIINVKDKRDEIVKLFLNFFFGFIFLTIAVFIFSDFKFPSGLVLGTAIYTGFFEVGITYILWLKAMQLSKNNATIGNLVFITPFLSLIFFHFILKETIFITTFIGIVFIVGGILFQQVLKGKIKN